MLKIPWTLNDGYDQLDEKYKEEIKEIHERQYHLSMDMILGEVQVRIEFLRRNFTKRQMNILTFIYNYSFGFAKEWALIPKMRDFEICGISSIKIRKELEQLIEMNVIEWKQEENLFRIKSPREWIDAPYNSGFSFDRSLELRRINLSHAGININE